MGVAGAHATINRWVLKASPQREAAFQRRTRPVSSRWRLDETSLRVNGAWQYLDRAGDRMGQTIECLLTAQRDERAAQRLLPNAIRQHGVPATITRDGSEAHAAAIRGAKGEHGPAIASRQGRDLNHIVEQEPRLVKRVSRPMVGFKSFEAAQGTLRGIARMPRLKQGQMVVAEGDERLTPPEPFYALAA